MDSLHLTFLILIDIYTHMHIYTHTHTHVYTKRVIFCPKLSASHISLEPLRIETRHAPIFDMSEAGKLSTYE